MTDNVRTSEEHTENKNVKRRCKTAQSQRKVKGTMSNNVIQSEVLTNA
jgi:hypothetical protein